MTDGFVTQVRLSVIVVLMRDIIEKTSDTDKQITFALRWSVWLSYLLSIGAISAGGLSIFLVAAILGTKPAQANLTEQSASLPEPAVEEEQAFPTNSYSSESNARAGYPQKAGEKGEEEQEREPPPLEGALIKSEDNKTIFNTANLKDTSDKLNLKASDGSVALTPKANTPYVTSAALSTFQELHIKDNAQPGCRNKSDRVALLQSADRTCTIQPEQLALTNHPIAQIPVFAPPSQNSIETFQRNVSTKFNFVSPVQAQPQASSVTALKARHTNKLLPLVPVKTTGNNNLLTSVPSGNKPSTVHLDEAPSLMAVQKGINTIEENNSAQLAMEDEPTPVVSDEASSPTQEAPAVYKGPGGASLLGGNIQAKSSFEEKLESPSRSQNSPQENNFLAPTLTLQGVVLNQGDTSARARLTGIYPISPNALFGGTVDLTTGDGFSDSPGGGLELNELYFTGSLPNLPNLRLTTGLVDLTSYFDRNSFAKDATTHFFNPVFQTNPALAAAGISSRPAVLLNWDITDNFQARATAFSSHRNLGDFAIDAVAGELAFRSGNAIIRGTFASDRDAGRNNGFREIYGLPRDNGETGLRSSDRENSYAINAEYFIAPIKMGLFSRYGRYENTSLDKGGDTYSLGLNFLDLFMKDDRLGFGYGRNLSNNDLRRDSGAKVPDVWELFYDFRLSPHLRAGVTLQARDEFSETIAGFRVKTEFDLTSLGRRLR